jgi:DNA-binding GntR family transcriptional regulator
MTLSQPDPRVRPTLARAFDGHPRPVARVRHGTTVETIVTAVRADILAGQLVAGAPLVESQMTDRFGVSRGPVREAFRRLQAEGLIDMVPNRGASVKRLSRRDVAEHFEIRVEIETLAARRAASRSAKRSDERELLRTSAAPDGGDHACEPAECLKRNERFHGMVFTISGNRTLEALSRKMYMPYVVTQIGMYVTREELRARMQDHEAIADAIIRGDADAAGEAMRRHIELTSKQALAILDERLESVA